MVLGLIGPDLRPDSILFACGMNAIRSPMAAALAKHLFPGTFYVQSVGVRCGKPDPFAAAVMEEIGLDISEHEPSCFDDLEDSYFDLIVSLAPEAHHRALEWSRGHAVETEYWPTMDPALVDRLTRADHGFLSCGARWPHRQAQGSLRMDHRHQGVTHRGGGRAPDGSARQRIHEGLLKNR